jgi:hypothetical protein
MYPVMIQQSNSNNQNNIHWLLCVCSVFKFVKFLLLSRTKNANLKCYSKYH